MPEPMIAILIFYPFRTAHTIPVNIPENTTRCTGVQSVPIDQAQKSHRIEDRCLTDGFPRRCHLAKKRNEPKTVSAKPPVAFGGHIA